MTEELLFIKNSLSSFDIKIDNLRSDFNTSFGKIEVLLEKLTSFEHRMDDSNKRIHKRIDANENRLVGVEHNQTTIGCPSLTNFISKREEQLKRYDDIIKDSTRRLNKVEDSLEELKSIPNKVLFRVVISLITAGIVGMSAYYFAEHIPHKDFVRIEKGIR